MTEDASRTTSSRARRGRAALLLLLAAPPLAAAGCASAGETVSTSARRPAAAADGAQDRATQLCDTAGRDYASGVGAVTALARAHPSDVAAFVRWEERDRSAEGGPSKVESTWRDRPQAQFVAVCYFDGDFSHGIPKGPPPGPGESPRPGYDRIGVVVTDAGEPRLLVAGRTDNLSVEEAPAAG